MNICLPSFRQLSYPITWFFLMSVMLTEGNAQVQPLRVSENGRFLVTADGKPFFWMGDTGWELFHQLSSKDADLYFKKRADQGFNVIQAVVLAERDGLHTPNMNGAIPLKNDDPLQPNEAYFAFVDSLIDLAAKYNLYIALLPTWGDKVFTNYWGKGPVIFNVNNARGYGRWIGHRYKDRKNIIWVVGGDRSPKDTTQETAIWRSMAQGVAEGVGGNANALMTFHPQPDGTSSSSFWFHKDVWLDVNMLQTGHCRDTPVWEMVSSDYNMIPAKPIVNGESIYEDMPVCFNAKELGYANAYDVRKAAYLSVFAGAAGHTYGCGPVIWFSEQKDKLFAAHYTWRESLDLPAANEMKWLRQLIESRPIADAIPAQDLLTDEGSCASDRIQARKGVDYAFVYSAYGRSIIIKGKKISGDKLNANWYNPRDGHSVFIGSFDNRDGLKFDPPLPKASPVPSQREDWILILDDASKNYKMPGKG